MKRATVNPRATEHIQDIIDLVKTLVEKGPADPTPNGDVYFSVRSWPGYGKLSGQNIDDLENGARVDPTEEKQDPLDFALWKGQKPGEPAWPSPWGMGRPGWHIECSAMSMSILGESFDIHGGGQDLIFPHHENEIAQSECCNGVPFARYWMHNGYINVDNKKMSKSLNNFFTVRDVANAYGYEAIRFFLISSSYRMPINYNTEIIQQGINALDRLYNCKNAMDFALANAADGEVDAAFAAKVEARRNQFIEAMDDDLNTADGIAALFELVKDINVMLTANPTKATIECGKALFDELTDVLGFCYERGQGGDDDEAAEIEALIEARATARKEKNWAEADRIRDELKARNIVLEDTPQGVKWHRA